MKKYSILVVLMFLLSFCTKKEQKEPCFETDAFEIEWLNEAKQSLIEDTFAYDLPQSIVMYTYNEEKVFEVNSCPDCPDAGVLILNCSKEEVCFFGGIGGLNTCPDFNEKATNKTVIYTE